MFFVTFNIESQSANTINNVIGNQTSISGPGAQVLVVEEAKQQLGLLLQIVRQLNLAPKTLATVEREIDEADKELASPQPNRRALGERLQRLTQILRDAGALATAGQALTTTLTNLAHWFGTTLAALV